MEIVYVPGVTLVSKYLPFALVRPPIGVPSRETWAPLIGCPVVAATTWPVTEPCAATASGPSAIIAAVATAAKTVKRVLWRTLIELPSRVRTTPPTRPHPNGSAPIARRHGDATRQSGAFSPIAA